MERTSGHKLETIVKNLSNLPSLPFIAEKIVSVADGRNSQVGDIVEVISIDQALTAKVLKLVNSSFYGFSTKITTVSRAVIILGLQTIKTLALGVNVFKTVSTICGGCVVFDMKKFWEHSLGVAAGSKLIARLIGFKQYEEAFLAGLLHDIGKIILSEYLPNEFAEALVLARGGALSLLEAENRIIRADHEVAGDYLAERWKLPFALKRSISQHHNPPFGDPLVNPEVLTLICVVSLSNTLCKLKNIGFSGNCRISGKDENVLQWLKIDEPEIERFFIEIDDELDKAKEFLGIIASSEGENVPETPALNQGGVLIVYKEKKRTILSSLYIKSLGFDCQKSLLGPELKSLLENGNFRVVLLDELSEAEALKIREYLGPLKEKIYLGDLPVPFNAEKLGKLLGKGHS